MKPQRLLFLFLVLALSVGLGTRARALITLDADQGDTDVAVTTEIDDFRVGPRIGQDQQSGVGTDLQNGDFHASTSLPGPGELLSSTVDVHTRITIDSEESAHVEVSGSFRIVHDFQDPLAAENIGSKLRAVVRVSLCSTLPLTFRFAGSGTIEGSDATYRVRGNPEVFQYASGLVIGGFDTAATGFTAGIGFGSPAHDATSAEGDVFQGTCPLLMVIVDEPKLGVPIRDGVVGPFVVVPELHGSFRGTLDFGPGAPIDGHGF